MDQNQTRRWKSRLKAVMESRSLDLGQRVLLRNVLLQEAEAERSNHPVFLKRCVYAIASKDPTQEGLSKAFAVCISNAQKSGRLVAGSVKPTAAGKAWEKQKKAEASNFTLAGYESLLKRVKDARKTESRLRLKSRSLLQIWEEVAYDLMLETRKDMPAFRKAVSSLDTAMQEFEHAIRTQNKLSIPSFIAQIISGSLGSSFKPGVMTAIGLSGLLGAVGIDSMAGLGKTTMNLLDALRGDPAVVLDWRALQSRAWSIRSLVKELQNNTDVDDLISVLSDLFLELALLANALRGDQSVNAAAQDVANAMRKTGKGFLTIQLAKPD